MRSCPIDASLLGLPFLLDNKLGQWSGLKNTDEATSMEVHNTATLTAT